MRVINVIAGVVTLSAVQNALSLLGVTCFDYMCCTIGGATKKDSGTWMKNEEGVNRGGRR